MGKRTAQSKCCVYFNRKRPRRLFEVLHLLSFVRAEDFETFSELRKRVRDDSLSLLDSCVVVAGVFSGLSELHQDTRGHMCDASKRLVVRSSIEIRVQVAAIGVSSASTRDGIVTQRGRSFFPP